MRYGTLKSWPIQGKVRSKLRSQPLDLLVYQKCCLLVSVLVLKVDSLWRFVFFIQTSMPGLPLTVGPSLMLYLLKLDVHAVNLLYRRHRWSSHFLFSHSYLEIIDFVHCFTDISS